MRSCGRPSDGTMTVPAPSGTDIKVDETYTYQCIDGYDNTANDLTVMCQQNFTFDKPPPSCCKLYLLL